MAKTDKTVSGVFQVGRFTADMTIGATTMTCEWSPREPVPGELTAADLRQYKAGRNRLIEQFTIETGLRVAVVG
jgi:hypothetical protein